MTTPHTEPESLAAWARRVAPTLTDEEWVMAGRDAASSGPFFDGDTMVCTGPTWYSPEQARGLLAELDRIAGELTEAQRAGLKAIDDGYTSMPYTVALSLGAMLSVAFHGHAQNGEHRAACNLTPLGRAVLARKAAQR